MDNRRWWSRRSRRVPGFRREAVQAVRVLEAVQRVLRVAMDLSQVRWLFLAESREHLGAATSSCWNGSAILSDRARGRHLPRLPHGKGMAATMATPACGAVAPHGEPARPAASRRAQTSGDCCNCCSAPPTPSSAPSIYRSPVATARPTWPASPAELDAAAQRLAPESKAKAAAKVPPPVAEPAEPAEARCGPAVQVTLAPKHRSRCARLLVLEEARAARCGARGDAGARDLRVRRLRRRSGSGWRVRRRPRRSRRRCGRPGDVETVTVARPTRRRADSGSSRAWSRPPRRATFASTCGGSTR